ncbi:helicase associated domain-containing protein [Verrucomicrobiota bacterium]
MCCETGHCLRMLRRLESFQRRYGHCNVRTNDGRYPQLGRWVAAVRHQKRNGGLVDSLECKLNALGFVWNPSDRKWEEMFAHLLSFRKIHGHCDVPRKWPEDQRLATWVHRQRWLRKHGSLPENRMRRLDEVGLNWCIYKTDMAMPREVECVSGGLESSGDAPRGADGHRLYWTGNGTYVQYGGKGKRPDVLERYVATHSGELPPFIPLPCGPVEFCFGNGFTGIRNVKWSGRGKVPREVLLYVQEKGTLPSYDGQ